VSQEDNIPEPPADEELPPPPSDIADEKKQFPELKVKKQKPLSTVRRAFIIFEKDLRTMAKHGLISAVILFVFLSIVFYIMSFAMQQAVSFKFEEGDGEGIPEGTGVDLPVADMSISPGGPIQAGTSVTLDASGSTDNTQIVFTVWSGNDGYQDIELYGEVVHHTFNVIGSYEIRLIVVDDEWNTDEIGTNITVNPATSDNQPPMANFMSVSDLPVGGMAYFDASGSTDNVGIVDYTWMFEDGIDRVLHGVNQSYTFNNAAYYNVKLMVGDAAGNVGETWFGFKVMPSSGDLEPPRAEADVPPSATVGDTVQLDASRSWDNQGGISSYTWYIEYNGTIATRNGQQTSFVADDFGPYNIRLVVRDNAGNSNTFDATVIATPPGMDLDKIQWTATPFGTDISFNVLTYSYGIALLASVIYVGGLFAKGFSHEITKGTVKVLFFGPISVTTMVFSKILYPLIVGPFFIFPLVAISLSRFGHPLSEVFMIGFVAYAFAAVTMVSAAYGSNMIYLAAKKMVLKPSIISRIFLYFSLLGTLTVFEWMSFLLDNWQSTDMWGNMYDSHSGIAVLSPFHQGGMLLSNMLAGTSWSLDLWVFAIPVLLIAGGVLASRKLYGDIFARE
jgi:hypothetical protein